MNFLNEKEEKIFSYLSLIKSAESLFTLERDELETMKFIVTAVLDFLVDEKNQKSCSESTSIQIYQILIEADQRLKFSQLFESNAMSIIVHFNLASCYQKSTDVKNALSHMTHSIIDFELFIRSFSKEENPDNFLLLKKRFVCVYLQTAALYSHLKNHQKALKVITTGFQQVLLCLSDFEQLACKFQLSHYQSIIDDLRDAIQTTNKPFSVETTLKKKLNESKFNFLIHNSKKGQTNLSCFLENSNQPKFKLSSKLLEYFSIQNVMSATNISLNLFENGTLQLHELNDIMIELVLYVSISYFAIATEKRYIGISECQYSDHKIEDGYGKKFLTSLQNEKSLLLNQNYIERLNKQRVLSYSCN